MRSVAVIARRELAAYFSGPVAYVVIAGFLLVSGFFYFSSFFVRGMATMEPFFGGLPLIFLFFCPAVAMRLLAEERGTGSLELLVTMPVRDGEVVLGKYLAALGLLVVALGCTLPCALTVARLGALDVGATAAGYLGSVLLGGTYLAVGLFASSITRSQVVAFLVGFLLCLSLWLVGMIVRASGPELARALEYVAPQVHFQKLARGIVAVRDLVYYASAIGLFLCLATVGVGARRWR